MDGQVESTSLLAKVVLGGLYVVTLGCLWKAVRRVYSQASKHGSDRSSQQREQYEQQRLRLANHGFLRSAYLGGAVVYVAALTYVQATQVDEVQPGQVTGLLLAYCVAVFVVWLTVMALVPFFETMLAQWSQLLAIITFSMYAMFCNVAPSLGVMHNINNLERVLSYDVPLDIYQNSLAAMSFLHLISHVQNRPQLLHHPSQLVSFGVLYLGFGTVVPALTQWVVQSTMRPSRFPSPLFRLVCVAANVLSVTDLILYIPNFSHSVQDAARATVKADWGRWSPAALLLSVLAERAPGQVYSYGLAPSLMLACSTVLLLITLTSSVVLTLCEEPHLPAESDKSHPSHKQHQFIAWLTRFEVMKPVLGFMRSLAVSHRYVLCGLLSLGSIQIVALLGLLVSTLVLPSDQLLRHVPSVLMSVLLGLLLQVAGVVHLVMPHKSSGSAAAAASDNGRTNKGAGSSGGSSLVKAGADGASGKQGRTRDGSQAGSGDESSGEFVTRLEALAHYKAFMQGLDAQPETYTMDDFISGSASAMQGVFPQVHHASFCILDHSGTSVNMYTFLGEGSQKPPRFGIAVAPSTLIYHVLHNCRPVFISNISAFPGPFSDVQFMRFVLGLKSVACLPLVSSQGRVLGVLRLGFQVPWEWTDPEKNVAKQVAFILSSGRNMEASVPPGTVFQQHPGMPDLELTSNASNAALRNAGFQNGRFLPQAPNGSERSASLSNILHEGDMAGASAHPLLNRSLTQGGAVSPASMQAAGMPWGAPPGPGSGRGVPGGGVAGWAAPTPMSGTMSPAGSLQAGGLNPSMLGTLDTGAKRAPSQQARWETGSAYSAASGSALPAGRMAPGGARSARGAGQGLGTRSHTATSVGPHDAQTDPMEEADEQDPLQAHGRDRQDLKLMEVIGRGGFGSVYKAMWQGKLVAVKVLEHGDEFLGCAGGDDVPGSELSSGGHGRESVSRKMDLSGRRAALLEGAMTSTINHPNVVATYDYRVVHLAAQPSKGLGNLSRVSQETHIVMEWCDKGSLQDAMEKGYFVQGTAENGTKTLDMEALCMTLAEVSSALHYLHTHRITHRDLKPKNVLLKSSTKDRRGFSAKVSDFGLSQVLPDTNRTQVSKNYSGTVTHMPPELIEDGKVYPAGDIYSFGIMMWEAYTGSTPYAHMAHPQIMVAVVTHNLRPRFPDSCPAWYKNLAYKCWAKDPKARPTFSAVTDILMGQIQDNSWEPVLALDSEEEEEQGSEGQVQ